MAHHASDLRERASRWLHRYTWPVGSVFIVLMAALLRLYKLDLKPLHHDEGVNAFFFLRLFRENFYRYDPANYHGPTLYYFALILSSISTLLFGERALNIVVLRLVPTLFGLATVCLLLGLRKYLGTFSALAGAGLVAVSPGAVYFSRDFIHEPIFVFLTLALVVAALRAYESATWLSTLSVSALAALLFATKETAGISLAVLTLALVISLLWRSRATTGTKGASFRKVIDRLGGPKRAAGLVLGAAAMFAVLEVIFYSSFWGNYPQGLYDALASAKLWAKTGATAHEHSFFTYFLWLGQEEPVLLILGAAGTLAAGLRRNLFPLFAGLWAFGLIAAYSLIPYKTPWLTLNFVIPLACPSGYAVAEAYQTLERRSQTASRIWLALMIVAIATSLHSTWQLNFYRYDDDRNPYVYAQTRREFLGLVEDVNTIAKRRGTGLQTPIAVMSPDSWPLPWYLRDYPRVGYYGGITQNRTEIVISSAPQAELLKLLLGNEYERIGEYPLWPGMKLVCFARRPTTFPR